MRPPRRAWLFATFPAMALACQLVDPESDLKDDLAPTDGGGAPDGSLSLQADGSVASDAGVDATRSDATSGDASNANLPFCQQDGNVGAAICDDFNSLLYIDANAAPEGGPNWASLDVTHEKNPGVDYYGASFNARLPGGPVDAAATCYLQSVPLPVTAGVWTLDFELKGTLNQATTGDPSYLAIVQFDFGYDAGKAGALSAQSFRLLAGTDETAKLVVIQTQLGMDAGPPITLLETGSGQLFLLPDGGSQCSIHVELHLGNPDGSRVTSTCPTLGLEPLGQIDPPLVSTPDGGTGLLLFGFEDFGGSFPSYGILRYDDVVLHTQ